MESLGIQHQSNTLVDLVEEKLLQYLKNNNYCIGNTIPNEAELASSLGVARSVVSHPWTKKPLVYYMKAAKLKWCFNK